MKEKKGRGTDDSSDEERSSNKSKGGLSKCDDEPSRTGSEPAPARALCDDDLRELVGFRVVRIADGHECCPQRADEVPALVQQAPRTPGGAGGGTRSKAIDR